VHREYLALIEAYDDIKSITCVDQYGDRLSPEDTHQIIIQKLHELQIL
jgi:hypothetical protein